MLNKLVEEKYTNTNFSNNSSTKNNSNQININNSALVKLTEEEQDKELNNNETIINEIEKKINARNDLELFARENQLTKEVEEVIEVPKKIIKDEANILSEDLKQNQIKKQIREKENEKDKEKRQKEIVKNSKRIEEYKKSF